MRRIILTQKDILYKLEELERNDIEHDKKIELIFEYIKQLEKEKLVSCRQLRSLNQIFDAGH